MAGSCWMQSLLDCGGLSLGKEQCCREDSLVTQHSRTHSEAQGLVQQHTQPSAGVAVVSLARYAATSLVLGTPTTPPPPLTTPHKEDGRSGKRGEEGRGMMRQASAPTFH